MISLINLEFPYPKKLDVLAEMLEYIFARTVTIVPEPLDPGIFLDSGRSQYNSSAIIQYLDELYGSPTRKILGITKLDLFIPILTFVFGEAQLNGSCAVVSAFRLDNTYYGLPANDALMHERLGKEAVHELGHTYGLIHCPDQQCVMYSSTYVEELDFKHHDFCARCRQLLRMHNV